MIPGKRQTIFTFILLLAGTAGAEEPSVRAGLAEGPANPAVATPPELYASPFLMRGMNAGNSMKFDNTLAVYENGKGGSAVSNVLLISGGYRVWRNLQIGLKVGFVANDTGTGPSAYSLLNGVASAMYQFKLPAAFHVSPSVGLTLPWGMGAGDNPDPNVTAAIKAGALNRSVLENSLFGVNYFGVTGGLSAGWIRHGLTLQADAAVISSFLGRASTAREPDKTKVNFTSGLHVGYFPIPQLSIGTEAHYQRYLTDVAAVVKDPTARDAFTLTVGARGHFRSGRTIYRPGVSYTRAFIGQEAGRDYHIVQVELGIAFK